jgi:hypothetical protein
VNSLHDAAGPRGVSAHERTPGQRRGPTRVATYDPPDPTLIEVKPEALDFWSRTLEQPPEKIRKAVQKVGPVLDTVKKELGIGGAD